MNRLLSGVATIALLGGLGLTGAPAASATAKYKACVKKSTGEMRMTKKKCKKGWKRISWTKSGPTGDKGPTGDTGMPNSLGIIYDGAGARVGTLLGATGLEIGMLTVAIDGGVYFYTAAGELLPTISVDFISSSCTGPAFVSATSASGRDEILQAWGLRPVYRTKVGATLGVPESYKPTGDYRSTFNQGLWRRDNAGACVAQPSFTGYLVDVEKIANGPTDRPGPLTIR